MIYKYQNTNYVGRAIQHVIQHVIQHAMLFNVLYKKMNVMVE